MDKPLLTYGNFIKHNLEQQLFNDLGLDEDENIAEDGYAAAKWLVYESGLDFINLKFNVYSVNPFASQQI